MSSVTVTVYGFGNPSKDLGAKKVLHRLWLWCSSSCQLKGTLSSFSPNLHSLQQTTGNKRSPLRIMSNPRLTLSFTNFEYSRQLILSKIPMGLFLIIANWLAFVAQASDYPQMGDIANSCYAIAGKVTTHNWLSDNWPPNSWPPTTESENGPGVSQTLLGVSCRGSIVGRSFLLGVSCLEGSGWGSLAE